MGHGRWLCWPCGWSYSHCRQSAVSPWVATVSLWVAVVSPWVVMLSLQVANGVTMGGHSVTVDGHSATRLPQQSHLSPATLPSTQVPPCHRGWGPHAAPLPPSHTTASGMGHPPALCPHPHRCPLPAWPQGPKKLVLGAFFCPVSQCTAPPRCCWRAGGALPRNQPHSPLSPCRAREPCSASAWPGARPPAPTCPRRTPALSATPPLTGKGTAGAGLSPDCPLVP